MTETKAGLAGTGFRGGICTCHSHGGFLKKRYKKLSDALADAAHLPIEAWVYPCPIERQTYHVTTHPIAGAQYIKAART